ncbi:MAG: radical SAM protein [bacterium]|nr:radical SAM protein [bacterium]
MKIIGTTGNSDIATVYIGEFDGGMRVEFVESVQPPLPRGEKWVLIVSTLFGCPVRCKICDAGSSYQGRLNAEEIFAQIDFPVERRYPNRVIPVNKFKIQFARMGDPAYNDAVLEVLRQLPRRYDAPGLMPSISTIAPRGCNGFFDGLLEIKRDLYRNGRFQFQFSLHTTDEVIRDELMPVRKWTFVEMADYGERFYEAGDRKIALNFALAKGVPVNPSVLLDHFDPAKYLIKITPLNPTYSAREHGLRSYIDAEANGRKYPIIEALRDVGYEVIISIGEIEENLIGSNCGQYVAEHQRREEMVEDGYAYEIINI